MEREMGIEPTTFSLGSYTVLFIVWHFVIVVDGMLTICQHVPA